MERLLIIEDDRGIRESLKDILELSGYLVFTAKDGKEGFESIISFKPELVLCDVRMPEMDGFELLESIKATKEMINMPVFIFLTAQVEKGTILQGKKLGADGYISKPFDHIDLLQTINDHLAKIKNDGDELNYCPIGLERFLPEIQGRN